MYSVKVRIFRGATIDDIKDFRKPYLKHSPTNIVSHVGTNNSIKDSSSVILNKPLCLKKFIHTELPESNVIISKIIDRSENGTAKFKISIKLAINLIEEVQKLRRKSFDRNSQKSGQPLPRLQYYVLNCPCDNGY